MVLKTTTASSDVGTPTTLAVISFLVASLALEFPSVTGILTLPFEVTEAFGFENVRSPRLSVLSRATPVENAPPLTETVPLEAPLTLISTTSPGRAFWTVPATPTDVPGIVLLFPGAVSVTRGAFSTVTVAVFCTFWPLASVAVSVYVVV